MYTLGLDLGPNSIGWALIDEKNEKIVDLGVRVFPEGVDQFDTKKEVSPNEGRRTARAMRRQSARRRRRKQTLRLALVEAGLFPANLDEQRELLSRDPLSLRARALDEKLSPHELGRVFYHLGQRRGFLSNRKKDRGDKEVEGMLKEMSDLDKEIDESGARTLGRLLHRKASSLDHCQRTENDHVRHRHTRRRMYEKEFDAVWKEQRRLGHAELLTDDLKYGACGQQEPPLRPQSLPRGLSPLQAFGLHGLIFFQRKMYWPRSAVGTCEYESKQPRCPRADRRAQRFRLLQEVNNLRYLDPDTREECRLADEQRTLLLDHLGRREKMTFDQIRKTLNFMESVKFNLEKGKRPALQGVIVDVRMAKKVGESWHDRPEDEKDEIVLMLIDNEREDDRVIGYLRDKYGMTADEAEAALDVDFPSGYLHLSLKAINKLLPHLERGLVYQAESDPEKSALHAAGYLRRDELQRRLFDVLPDPARTHDCPIGDLPNPVVKRTLVELRKVVNAILRTYGKPNAIHVEMARDVKTRPKRGTEAYRKNAEYISQMRLREKRRDEAADKLRESSVTVSRDNIARYLLWGDQKQECIYSGKPISFSQLFGGEIDVDHILPRSRSLDDSQNNKVVCFRDANSDKTDRTPYEWLANADPERYEQICQRAGRLMHDGQISYPKYRRFLQKELKLDDFIERQLNDTRYIARLAGEYLRCLFQADHQVLGIKGQLTAELRRHWGVVNLLEDLPDSPAWQESNNLRQGEKNRADHRHHAIDAAVISLTTRQRLNELARIHREGGTKATGELVLDPWLSLRDDLLAALRKIHVSQRSRRGVSGRLHEDKPCGMIKHEGVSVSRISVSALSTTANSPNRIENIVDEGIKRIVVDRLRERGIEYGPGTRLAKSTLEQALVNLTMPSGVPIKKVRVKRQRGIVETIRKNTPNEVHVKLDNTHHVCIFEFEENGRTKREVRCVRLLEATERLKEQHGSIRQLEEELQQRRLSPKEYKRRRSEEIRRIIVDQVPVIARTHPDYPEAKFVMSLSWGEMVWALHKGEEKLLVFRTYISTRRLLRFVEHTDARKSSECLIQIGVSSFNARKVTVDPLGRIRWAND